MGTRELIGAWRGAIFDTGHPNNLRTTETRWHGKHFISADRSLPDVCVGEDGTLTSDGSNGSLWMVEFRGEVTATLVYDDQPIMDHFKRVDETHLLGIMNCENDRKSDLWLYFWLERENVPLIS